MRRAPRVVVVLRGWLALVDGILTMGAGNLRWMLMLTGVPFLANPGSAPDGALGRGEER